jgi:shikimate kinase
MTDIFLTGPKHSGKTTVGKALAFLRGCAFIDLDELITERAGKTPRALYRESPEIFKKAETEALATLMSCGTNETGRIIAAGGGIIDNPDALALLKNSCAVLVYLEVSAGTAWERIIANSGGELPSSLPAFLQTANPQETHRALHERRAAAYQQLAKMVINAEGKSPQQIADEIHGQLTGMEL